LLVSRVAKYSEIAAYWKSFFSQVLDRSISGILLTNVTFAASVKAGLPGVGSPYLKDH
jgi:hypothetical protein